MSVTVQLVRRQHTSAKPAGPVASQTLVPHTDWSRLDARAAVPVGGCIVRASSDHEAFRIALGPPGDTPPAHGGFLVNGGGPVFRAVALAGRDAQIWLRAA